MNYAKLRGKIAESGMTQAQIASHLGISPNTMTKKMNNRAEFNLSEVAKLCSILAIKEATEKADIFLQ